MKTVGFTGTRWGMSRLQSEKVSFLLTNAIKQGFDCGAHGDCQGSVKQFHDMLEEHQLRMNIYPPSNDKLRAHCKSSFASILPPKDYLERDRLIVNASDLIIAAPKSMMNRTKGGAWYTANYAIKQGKPVVIVDPNGVCEYHNFTEDQSSVKVENSEEEVKVRIDYEEPIIEEVKQPKIINKEFNLTEEDFAIEM